ncbi:ABC transporter permease [Candidatus Pacearchaeota archaeon]|nr:ABC transporter permease [Candidatus Pacearchaeota archaeon]
MKLINWTAISTLWLREMKRFLRARSRIIGTLGIPILSLAFFSMGLSGVMIPGIPEEIDYVNFLMPGMIGATILFSAMFSGVSFLWDREFGFLKEIVVTPVSRISIVLGRVFGSVTITMIQGLIILSAALFMRIKTPTIQGVLWAALFMFFISITFIGLGLIFASRMSDVQGFNLIMNFMIFPLFLLSGAMLPLQNLPKPVFYFTYINPLMYGVDGLRASLMKFSIFPKTLDLIVLAAVSVVMIVLGSYMFEKSKSY